MRIRVIPSQQIVKNMCDCVCVCLFVCKSPNIPLFIAAVIEYAKSMFIDIYTKL